MEGKFSLKDINKIKTNNRWKKKKVFTHHYSQSRANFKDEVFLMCRNGLKLSF